MSKTIVSQWKDSQARLKMTRHGENLVIEIIDVPITRFEVPYEQHLKDILSLK